MFKTLFATPLCYFWLFSLFISVFYATDAVAQQANFVKFETPIALPPMVIQDLEGRSITFKSILDQTATKGIALLHLWSPACHPCIKEIRHLDKAKTSLAAKGMPVLSLAEDPHGAHTVPAFIRRQAIDAEGIYIDKNLKAMKTLGAPGVPVTYIVSKEGLALAVHEGPMSW